MICPTHAAPPTSPSLPCQVPPAAALPHLPLPHPALPASALPCTADEGLKLFGEDSDYGSIAREIESVEGVVAHGLMANVAAAAVVAGSDGPRLVWRGDQLESGSGSSSGKDAEA